MQKKTLLTVGIVLGLLVLCCTSTLYLILRLNGFSLTSDLKQVQTLEKSFALLEKYKVTELYHTGDCEIIKYAKGFFFNPKVKTIEHVQCKFDTIFYKNKPKPENFNSEVQAVYDEVFDLLDASDIYDLEASYTLEGKLKSAQFTVSCFSCRKAFLYQSTPEVLEGVPGEISFTRIEGTDHWLRRDEELF